MAFQAFLKPFAIEGVSSMYLVPPHEFSELPIRRWKFNRPADETRVQEIREWIMKSNRVDGIIYLACVDHELVCYDSNHRREAIRGLHGIDNIFVHVLWNVTDDDVKGEFIRLNKAVSVPELYVVEDYHVQLDELRKMVDDFCTAYPSMRVSSKHPQRPNFTRDMVTDEFYRVMKEQKISVSELVEYIAKRNQELSMNDKSKLRERVIQKCEQSGLWLFAWSSKIQ